jgi:hypothetical protein
MRLTAQRAIVATLVLNVVMFGSACKTATVRQSGALGQSPQTDLSKVTMTADSIRRTSVSTFQYRGHVEIAAGAAVVTADEADLTVGPNGSTGFDLRGNVHLRVTSGR